VTMTTVSLSEFSTDQLCNCLPRATGFNEAIRIIESVRKDALGEGHLTVNANITPHSIGTEIIVLQRMWSAIPSNDPVAGRKIKHDTPWTRTLLRQGEIFVAEGDAAMAEAFDDHERLRALDLHAIVNVPTLEQGRCVATMNILTCRHTWSEENLLVAKLLSLAARAWILREKDELLARLALDAG
jgi:GAF domain-containing protein